MSNYEDQPGLAYTVETVPATPHNKHARWGVYYGTALIGYIGEDEKEAGKYFAMAFVDSKISFQAKFHSKLDAELWVIEEGG